MICAWKEFLAILPPWMRTETDKYGHERLQELRLRINAPPELVCSDGLILLGGQISRNDLHYCINAASRYSPWNAATAARGYLTAPGGHRIGLCGACVCMDGKLSGIRELTSLCIRVARDFPGIADKVKGLSGSILVIGAPGWGKTTLLRDVSRSLSEREPVSVVDERGELFPAGIPRGKRMDVLTGCPKTVGIEMLLRVMGPAYIAVDEITANEDCEALLQAANCGVHLLATAHAADLNDFLSRVVYKKLVEQNIFNTLLVLHSDKTYSTERMAK